MTLWALTLTWPCDYAQIERPRPTVIGSTARPKPPVSISVHLDGCRRCMMQKNLLYFDEMLKRAAEASFQQFLEASGQKECGDLDCEGVTEMEFEAIKEHAQVVRDEMLGCPKT